VAIEYFTINLQIAIETMTMERVKNILSTFSCALNNDIEHFLKERAIEFSNLGIARTHLILHKSLVGLDVLGYYALTNKVLTISPTTSIKLYEKAH
jgi:hypothetical protein